MSGKLLERSEGNRGEEVNSSADGYQQWQNENRYEKSSPNVMEPHNEDLYESISQISVNQWRNKKRQLYLPPPRNQHS